MEDDQVRLRLYKGRQISTRSYTTIDIGRSKAPEVRKPKTARTIEELGTYLRSLSETNFETYGDLFTSMFWSYCTDEARLEEAVTLVFDTAVADREYVHLGLMVYLKIKEQDKASRFITPLLGHLQREFKRKAQIRSTSIESWLSIFTFMCEVYVHILIGGQPINVLGSAVFSTMDYILSLGDCVDDDEIECICTNLKFCGAQLESAKPESMKKIIDSLRRRLLSKNSSCRVRCVIMEVLELRAMGWKDPQKQRISK